VDAVGDADLPLDVAGLALLVDAQADDRGAVLLGQRNTRSSREPASPSSRLAELRMARPPIQLEAGLDHLGLGRVEHERHVGLGGEALAISSMSAVPSRPT
jgi:hypothetical protein